MKICTPQHRSERKRKSRRNTNNHQQQQQRHITPPPLPSNKGRKSQGTEKKKRNECELPFNNADVNLYNNFSRFYAAHILSSFRSFVPFAIHIHLARSRGAKCAEYFMRNGAIGTKSKMITMQAFNWNCTKCTRRQQRTTTANNGNSWNHCHEQIEPSDDVAKAKEPTTTMKRFA